MGEEVAGCVYVCVCDRILFSHLKKKKILSSVTTWMALEGVTLNEMSQPETDQHRVVPLTCGLSKRLDSQKQQDRGRRVLGWGQGERSGKGYKLSVMKKVRGANVSHADNTVGNTVSHR